MGARETACGCSVWVSVTCGWTRSARPHGCGFFGSWVFTRSFRYFAIPTKQQAGWDIGERLAGWLRGSETTSSHNREGPALCASWTQTGPPPVLSWASRHSRFAAGGGPVMPPWGPASAEFASGKACLLVACDSRLIRIGCEQQRALQLVPALQYTPTPSSVKFTERYLNKTYGTRNSKVI